MTEHPSPKSFRHPAPSAGECDPDEAMEAAREEALEEFDEWRGRDWRNREFEDFSEWLVRMAQPHMRDHQRYAEAMNWRERQRVDLSALSRGARNFARDIDRARERRVK